MAALRQIAAVLILIFSSAFAEDDAPEVTVKQGPVRGVKNTAATGKTFLAFKGIPYAKPPVGERRFKPPEPVTSWNGTHDGTYDRNMCPQWQMRSSTYQGDEDCLHLNIYTNKLPENDADLRAVMVWIHGGAFTQGTSHPNLYGPDYLLSEDIILVSIQYRLGMLGFLHFPEAVIQGNNGLKDQALALKWVQENIDKFGGDPKNVTIFGESAGGASVHYHLLSPNSQGLFQRAISHSGTALNVWAYADPQNLSKSRQQASKELKCKDDSIQGTYHCFMHASAESIVTQTLNKMKFLPTKEEPSAGAFITETPDILVSSGRFQNVPYITGSNAYEAELFLIGQKPLEKEHVNIFFMFLGELYPKFKKAESSKQNKVEEEVKKVYFAEGLDANDGRRNVMTDVLFLLEIDKTAKEHSANSSAPVFYYYFSYDGKLAVMKMMGLPIKKGPTHADELGYLFHNAKSPKIDDSLAFVVSRRMIKMWTDFAKTGHPTPYADSNEGVKWDAFTINDQAFMNIDKDNTMAAYLHKERLAAWEGLN